MKKPLKQKAKEAEEMILAPRIEPAVRPEDLLSTGSTVLNLALSGRPSGGVAKGFALLLIGDPGSGKSWISCTILAEASISREFKDYRLIYDNPENGIHMDLRQYFGKRMFDRLEPPGGTRSKPVHSRTVEEFYDFMDDATGRGKPFIYVLDSMDALRPEAEEAAFAEAKKARRTGKEVKGSFGMAKAKANSQNLRTAVNKMRDTGSILVIICQTRDNTGPGALYNPRTRSGGHALEFYARLVVWTKNLAQVKKSLSSRDKEVIVGGTTEAKVTKNSISGWKGRVTFDFLRDVGIDDVGGMVDYLVDWKHWAKENGKISATELGVSLRRDALIRHIEDKDKEEELREVVAATWAEVEEESRTHRKRRYG